MVHTSNRLHTEAYGSVPSNFNRTYNYDNSMTYNASTGTLTIPTQNYLVNGTQGTSTMAYMYTYYDVYLAYTVEDPVTPIYNAIVGQGVTPASSGISDIVTTISNGDLDVKHNVRVFVQNGSDNDDWLFIYKDGELIYDRGWVHVNMEWTGTI